MWKVKKQEVYARVRKAIDLIVNNFNNIPELKNCFEFI